MAWIKTIPFDAATGKLKTLYDRVTGPGGNVDNIMMMHSLRPQSMEGHMALYKAVLHHSGNSLPKWYLEVLGVWVSSLNDCGYCVEHHFAGLQRLLRDAPRGEAIRAAIEARNPQLAPLEAAERAGMVYARKLTEAPAAVIEADINALRAAGLDDGQILEINQVTAYFSYANRTVLGLGCSTKGDVLGLSPNNSENPEDWGHS
ncbi:peroxidase-related enzyme [Phaeobacter gallaeciensis]|uniref:Peroxidase-related protein enzyme n=1 Tax=Phaeobacter gallaeciensis TaxID=60890 RepID=A0AAD0ECG4_9RHOB|nr:peroxidase-related enzyme [Phaeobacter gallaeciensis]AHD09037.1 putative peroxidase-related protein enzyme [Phaeobacter gallaeciensis DSM 26640]ATE92303.1 putative peroxidase-related protein enzyme [Phaeobacter gallaeciensis]ATE97878.1 putative peroxidase-related protein enzyme [Phaeobacter gallaeciensis]ATF00965.1 putative peroxidase-related protein enzyme [Phaeobacter gallaeciensis]ATF05345.1 putative peroxidase-related protein enzyme [Phaeobacter gallaeciensis]